MGRFKLSDRVGVIGSQEVRMVVGIRATPGRQTQYWIQRGSDFSTRMLASEAELELANTSDSNCTPNPKSDACTGSGAKPF